MSKNYQFKLNPKGKLINISVDEILKMNPNKIIFLEGKNINCIIDGKNGKKLRVLSTSFDEKGKMYSQLSIYKDFMLTLNKNLPPDLTIQHSTWSYFVFLCLSITILLVAALAMFFVSYNLFEQSGMNNKSILYVLYGSITLGAAIYTLIGLRKPRKLFRDDVEKIFSGITTP